MKVLLVANDELKNDWVLPGADGNLELYWVNDPAGADQATHYDACIDLLFENTPARIEFLCKLSTSIVIVNSVISTLAEMQQDFVRINGWRTLLKRPVVEAAGISDDSRQKAAKVFSAFGRKTEWVTDKPGFVTSRVIASIINEAYFALGESVSSKQEIDIAMKLGTNYPYGPFEWSEKIGLKNIYALLDKLAGEEKRYEPATLLTREAII